MTVGLACTRLIPPLTKFRLSQYAGELPRYPPEIYWATSPAEKVKVAPVCDTVSLNRLMAGSFSGWENVAWGPPKPDCEVSSPVMPPCPDVSCAPFCDVSEDPFCDPFCEELSGQALCAGVGGPLCGDASGQPFCPGSGVPVCDGFGVPGCEGFAVPFCVCDESGVPFCQIEEP